MPRSANHIRVTEIIDADVHVNNGGKFGRVADIILDKSSYRILFVIIARDGTLTATNNFYRVGWHDLNYDETLGGYVTASSAEALEEARADSSIEPLLNHENLPST